MVHLLKRDHHMLLHLWRFFIVLRQTRAASQLYKLPFEHRSIRSICDLLPDYIWLYYTTYVCLACDAPHKLSLPLPCRCEGIMLGDAVHGWWFYTCRCVKIERRDKCDTNSTTRYGNDVSFLNYLLRRCECMFVYGHDWRLIIDRLKGGFSLSIECYPIGHPLTSGGYQWEDVRDIQYQNTCWIRFINGIVECILFEK